MCKLHRFEAVLCTVAAIVLTAALRRGSRYKLRWRMAIWKIPFKLYFFSFPGQFMLRITGPQTLDKVEAELDRLSANPEKEIQIPVRPQKWWLGGELALVQLTATWARLQPEATLVTHIAPDEDPERQLKALSRRLFGFTSLLLADEIVDRNRSEDRNLKSAAYAQCQTIARRMHGPVSSFAMGAKVFLVCVDHSTLWAIPWLYSKDAVVADRISFTSLVKQLIEKISIQGTHQPITHELLPKLGAILHELFKNTDEWGKTNINRRPFRRSVRGLTVERHRWHKTKLPLPENYPAFKRFFAMCPEFAEHYRFLEFSVFDTGVGLAKQWLKLESLDSISLSEELIACEECLRKNRTSSHNRNKGLGLAEVMSTLNELGAFLRLRTGRLSLYRDFRSQPMTTSEDANLFDLRTSSLEPTGHAQASGAAYQILIPLTENS